MVDRKGPIQSKKRKGPSIKKGSRVPFVLITAVLVSLVVVALVLATIGLFVKASMENASAEVRKIEVTIQRDVCNVSVSLDLDLPFGKVDERMVIEHGNGSEELSFIRGKASGSVTEQTFRSILDDGNITVKGTYRIRLLGVAELKDDVRTEFDISSIARSLKDLEANNVSMAPTLTGYVRVTMDLRADLDERLELIIEDTTAELGLVTGVYTANVVDLRMVGGTGLGRCTLSVPLAAVISIAFLDRTVEFDCFGISGTFDLPLSAQ